MQPLRARADVLERDGTRRPPARGARLGAAIDALLEVAVVSFAGWTLLYHLALVVDVGGSLALAGWGALTAAVAVVRLRRVAAAAPWPGGRREDRVAALLAAGTALLASVLVRPDLDDASYVVRSARVAATGRVEERDVIFTAGALPPLPEQAPYLPSFETLLGLLARVTGVSAGTMVYTVAVPLLAFAATWALWTLLREWSERRRTAGLLLALTYLLLGASTSGAWGNLHLGRIWQGKIVFLAVLVPLVYAYAARVWRHDRAGRPVARARTIGLVGLTGVAAVGLTPAAVFVLPLVAVAAAVPGLARRRWGVAACLVAAGSAYPLAAGAVVVVAGRTAAAIPGTGQLPWARTLGTGVELWVAVAAGAVVLVAALARRGGDPVLTASGAVVLGVLVGTPWAFEAAVRVMGTDAVAWRLVWAVPVPALVGLLPGLLASSARPLRWGVPAVLALVLAVGGTPVWSSANGAHLAAPGAWKMAPADLEAARWVVAHGRAGTYLAPVGVTAAVGVLSDDLRPAGTRVPYIQAYDDHPQARSRLRALLQLWADDTVASADAHVHEALEALDVRVACLAPTAEATALAGWTPGLRDEHVSCWLR